VNGMTDSATGLRDEGRAAFAGERIASGGERRREFARGEGIESWMF
jgi:hypothetical protein